MPMEQLHSEHRILTVPQAARIFGVTRMTMWRWVQSELLASSKTPGGHHRIAASDLKAFVQHINGDRSVGKPSSKPRILVVDDSVAIQKLLLRLLFDWGYEAKACSDGFEAGIRVLKFQPHLIVLDLYMPHINGLQVCRSIKKDLETSAIKIVAMSGNPDETNSHRALSAGADVFMAKPLDREILMRHIKRLLAEQGVENRRKGDEL